MRSAALNSARRVIEASLPPEAVLFGQTSAMGQVRAVAEQVAETRLATLITGESGTGKDVMARWLHEHSPQTEDGAPFVRVSCPALPASLVESELFGHEAGAFTGAAQARPGWVELAAGGTLFLDEIGEFAPELQAKLLQLLQEGLYARLGASEASTMRARVVCATHRNLAADVERGSFRADLYYRISAVTLALPPLRERQEDIPALVDYFLAVYEDRYRRPAPALSPRLRTALGGFAWPGNIRQLQNLIKRLVILGTETVIEAELAQPAPAGAGLGWEPSLPGGNVPLKQLTRAAVDQLERMVITRALREHNWNRRRVARALDISYRALLYKIKKFNLPSKRVAAPEIEAGMGTVK